MPSATRSPSTGSGRRTTGYFAISRAPRYSVLFALPLLLGYEGLAALLSQPGRSELRNGADVMLREAFIFVAGPRGGLIFMAAVILLGVGLVARDLKRSGDRPRLVVFLGMLAESTALAAIFGVAIGLTTAKLLGSLHSLSIAASDPLVLGQLEHTSWTTRLMLSLGAGLYEELFFRVLLVGGLAAGARIVLGFGPRAAGFLAATVGAVVFSAFHYIGPFGDHFTAQSFTFRLLSGLAFSGLYLVRGFGITAWTHALYDSFLLLS
jgi:hypothetical protein